MSVDSRILHVQRAYNTYENLGVKEVLSAATDKFVEQFKKIRNGHNLSLSGAGSVQEAQLLTSFFQQILDVDSGKLEDVALQEIVTRAKNIMTPRVQKLFVKNMSGERFEQVLSAIVIATIEKASVGNVDLSSQMKNVNLGNQTFLAGSKLSSSLGQIGNQLINDVAVATTNMVSEQVSQDLQKQINSHNNPYVDIEMKRTNAKADVSGIALSEIEISVAGNAQLATIARLLQRASFSAKAYNLQGLKTILRLHAKKHGEQYIKQTHQLQDISLKLGNTKLDTVFFALFGADYPSPVILSMLYYCLNTSDEEVRLKLGTLRFIYELTGYGQSYVNNFAMGGMEGVSIEQRFEKVVAETMISAGFDEMAMQPFRVNYFIWYNEDAHFVVVRSAADLIVELRDEFANAEIISLSASQALGNNQSFKQLLTSIQLDG